MKRMLRFLLKELNQIKSLYKGISSGLFGNVVTNAVYFLSYKYFQKVFLNSNFNFKEGQVMFSLITSFLAALSTTIITNPIWVLNTRIANSTEHV